VPTSPHLQHLITIEYWHAIKRESTMDTTDQFVSLLSLRTSSYFSAIAGSLTSFDMLRCNVGCAMFVDYEESRRSPETRGCGSRGDLHQSWIQILQVYVQTKQISCLSIRRRSGRAVMAVCGPCIHPTILHLISITAVFRFIQSECLAVGKPAWVRIPRSSALPFAIF
jgi:hypothetical protein